MNARRFFTTRFPGLATISCVALAFSACGPSAGVKALRASQQAMREAKSWQVAVVEQTRNGWTLVRIDSVECPARWDRTSHVPETSYREIWFDGVHYEMDAGGTFIATDMPFPSGCGSGPSLASSGILYDDLDAIADNGEVRPGHLPVGTPGTQGCTWWDAAPAKGAEPKYSVCLNEDDHLPRSIRSVEQGHTYAYTLPGWNVTTVTLPPGIVVPGH